MRTRIKICGITRDQDALAAVRAGADAIGFVFWPSSPRRIAPADASQVGRDLPALVARVGVFVNASPAEVARIVRRARLDAIQLHGDEPADAYLQCGAAVIKAVSVMNQSDLRVARAIAPQITLLVDVRDPVRRGGTGQRANWRLARALSRTRPILLAGGLSATTAVEAIRTVRPWGLDVSSGVEVRPGIKSARKMAAFCARVAQVDREAR